MFKPRKTQRARGVFQHNWPIGAMTHRTSASLPIGQPCSGRTKAIPSSHCMVASRRPVIEVPGVTGHASHWDSRVIHPRAVPAAPESSSMGRPGWSALRRHFSCISGRLLDQLGASISAAMATWGQGSSELPWKRRGELRRLASQRFAWWMARPGSPHPTMRRYARSPAQPSHTALL